MTSEIINKIHSVKHHLLVARFVTTLLGMGTEGRYPYTEVKEKKKQLCTVTQPQFNKYEGKTML